MKKSTGSGKDSLAIWKGPYPGQQIGQQAKEPTHILDGHKTRSTGEKGCRRNRLTSCIEIAKTRSADKGDG